MYPSRGARPHAVIVHAPRLNTARAGAGPPLVLIHGWGLGLHAFDPVLAAIAPARTVVRVDLPGCGGSRPDRCGPDLEAIARTVLAAVPGPAWWCGWSLGGLVALAAARIEPAAVSGVTLVAATPRFVRGDDWPGIDGAQLAAFARELATDAASAHGRFLAFQLAGSAGARRALRSLRAACARDGRPDDDTLAAGLQLLRGTDLRDAGALSCPVQAILGSADPLVPVSTGARLGGRGWPVTIIDGAGHAPFASHPARFAEALLERSIE